MELSLQMDVSGVSPASRLLRSRVRVTGRDTATLHQVQLSDRLTKI